MGDEFIGKDLAILITRSILCVSICIVFGIWIYSCNLSQDIIDDCRTACNDSDSRMESVTTSKCICSDKKSDNWVIPRVKSK